MERALALLDFLHVIGEIVEEISKSNRNGEKRHEYGLKL